MCARELMVVIINYSFGLVDWLLHLVESAHDQDRPVSTVDVIHLIRYRHCPLPVELTARREILTIAPQI